VPEVEDGAASVADVEAMAARIIDRATIVKQARVCIGVFEFVAFCCARRRRLIACLVEGEIDIMNVFAPQLMDATWAMEPYATRLILCGSSGCGADGRPIWVPRGWAGASHFMAGVPLGRAAVAAARGSSVAAVFGRLGVQVVPTIADGDCGPDALNIVTGSARSVFNRNALRTEISDTMIANACRPEWQEAFAVCQEHVELGAPPAVAGAAVVVAGTAVAGAAAGQTALELRREAPAANLELAVRWATGIPNPTAGMIRRLCAGLTDESASQIVALHGQHSNTVANMPSPITAVAVNGVANRSYRQTRLCQRMMDARAFVAHAVGQGVDHRTIAGRRLIRPWLQANSASALSKSRLHDAYRYMCRCLEGLGAGHATSIAKRADKPGARGCVLARYRKRAQVHQGRPQKAVPVKDALYDWFCSIKRSVMTRLPAKLVLGKAQALMEEWVGEHVQRGLPAVAGSISKVWLLRWRRCYGVSLRQPNRKWSVPRKVLVERLETTWLNVFRVRKFIQLHFGYDPVIENFDQSPFHMNEIGSKQAKSLAIRGCGTVPLKEGHAATRERWTANTMVTSSVVRARALPPLELMFKAKGGGKTMGPRLRDAVPPWAPWLTVTTSESGSYNEHDVLNYLEAVLEEMHVGRDWRILLVDAYSAQTTDAVRRCAWHRGYVLCVHGGGTTSILQVNDTELHQPLKTMYMEFEAADAVQQSRLRPKSCPVPRKEDCIQWMASVWNNPDFHAAVSDGFWKTGLACSLDDTADDHRVVKEAKAFWNEIGIPAKRREAVDIVKAEYTAGRLTWDFHSVSGLVLPFPAAAPRYNVQPDDDGSDAGDGDGSASDSDSDEGSEPGDDGDGAAAVSSAVAGSSGSCAIASSSTALEVVPPLLPEEVAQVNDHHRNIDVLQCVLSQVEAAGMDTLAATVVNCLRAEERKAYGRCQPNPAIARAMLANRQVESDAIVVGQSIVQAAVAAADRQRRHLAALAAEENRLAAQSAAMRKASTALESVRALRRFDIADLGQGHPQGGTRQHVEHRLEILERVKAKSEPLPAELENDWGWFKKHWDTVRLNHYTLPGKSAWGALFRDLMLGLLDKIAKGERHVLANFMYEQIRLYLPMPAIRV
jgi:hypothetical protein